MATGEDNGKPLIFRIRDGAPGYATKASFPKLFAVTWRFDPTTNNGMPLPYDLARMQQLENLLEPVFANARQAFLTGVVTGNGVREWQWYAKNPEEVIKFSKADGTIERSATSQFPGGLNFERWAGSMFNR